jgi:hypothetical protein
MKLCYPWKMVGEYADGEQVTVGGSNEEDCMQKLIDRIEQHGELTWYSGVTDEDYQFGKYIGEENFIYD